jgi:hypothetical protein
MDVYRILSRAREDWECKSEQYLWDLYHLAYPSLLTQDGTLDVDQSIKLRDKFFFPRSKVKNFVTKNMLKEIIRCGCAKAYCQSFERRLSGPEADELVEFITSDNHIDTAAVTVANLVYLRETRLLNHIYSKGGF